MVEHALHGISILHFWKSCQIGKSCCLNYGHPVGPLIRNTVEHVFWAVTEIYNGSGRTWQVALQRRDKTNIKAKYFQKEIALKIGFISQVASQKSDRKWQVLLY